MKPETETKPPRIRIRRSKPILDLTLPDNQEEHAKRMLEYAQNESPQIEKGIPMPDPLQKGRRFKYRLHDMEVGDSYFRSGNPKTAGNALRQAVVNFKKRNPDVNKMEFIIAPCEGGARIWRRT